MARKMKDSGVEWIGEIPLNWKVKRNKQLFYEVNDRCDNGNEHILLSVSEYYGIAPKSEKISEGEFETRAESLDGYKLCKVDDIIMNIMLAWKHSTGRSDYDGIVSPAYCVYRKRDNINTMYYHYLFRTDIVAELFKRYSTGIIDSRLRLYPDKFMSLRMIVPPYDEQNKIVTYLKQKCFYIDFIIKKTKKSLEEYKKLKQAVITQAVIKGVRDNREMRDSRIEWIGEIPIEWKLIPFRHVLKERQEKNSPIKSKERLSLSIDLGVTLYAEKTTNLDRFKDDFEQYKLAHEGDLVMNSMNMIVGATGVSDYFGCVSPVYYTYYDELEDHITAKYCEYIFKSKSMLRVLYSLGKGIYAIVRGDDRVNTCRLKVSKEDLKNIIIPVPPEEEQREIVNYLKEKSKEIDELIIKKEQYLTEMDNYKKSLIYEYVTGKKEVSQWN